MINLRRIEHTPGPIWKLCGQDADYGLLTSHKPKQLAIDLIRQVFTDDEIVQKRFVYLPHRYRGRQSMMDEILVWYR